MQKHILCLKKPFNLPFNNTFNLKQLTVTVTKIQASVKRIH